MSNSRVVKSASKHVLCTLRTDMGHELSLVRGGKLAYLWIGPMKANVFTTVSGPGALRALARAILKELPRRGRSKGK